MSDDASLEESLERLEKENAELYESRSAIMAKLKEIQSEFAILSRACGNWREWPDKTVSTDLPDYTHDDWKAAAKAILERDKLRAILEAKRL